MAGAAAGISGGQAAAGQVQGLLGGIASVIAESQSQEENRLIGTGDPLADPLSSGIALEILLGLGLVSPTSISRGSPINVAAQTYLNTTTIEIGDDEENFEKILQGAVAKLEGGASPHSLTGREKRELDRVAAAVGMTRVELMDAQAQFDAQFGDVMRRAAANREARLGAEGQLNALIGDLPSGSASSLDALRGMERERLDRDIGRIFDRRTEDTVRMANAGNFNPGLALRELEELRTNALQDSDLDALGRAVALLGSQQGLATNEASLLADFLGGPIAQGSSLVGSRLGATNVPVNQFSTLPGTLSNSFAAASEALFTQAAANQAGGNLSSLGSLGQGGGAPGGSP